MPTPSRRRTSLSWSTRSGRALLLQGALLALLAAGGYALARNVEGALAARQIRSGFAFVTEPAGFDIVWHADAARQARQYYRNLARWLGSGPGRGW